MTSQTQEIPLGICGGKSGSRSSFLAATSVSPACLIPAMLHINISFLYLTGKAISVQACTDPAGSRRLRLPDLETVGT
jgi:hypothetical protein